MPPVVAHAVLEMQQRFRCFSGLGFSDTDILVLMTNCDQSNLIVPGSGARVLACTDPGFEGLQQTIVIVMQHSCVTVENSAAGLMQLWRPRAAFSGDFSDQ